MFSKKIKRRNRKTEFKRGFFRARRTPRGPKIYLSRKKTVQFEHLSMFWPKMYFFIFILAIGSFLYLIFFSSIFQFKEIAVLGSQKELNEKIKVKIQENLNNKFFFILPKNNYLFLNNLKLESLLKNEFPEIKTITIMRKFPNLLKTKVELKNFKFVWVRGDLELNSVQSALEQRLKQIENQKYKDIIKKEDCVEDDEICKNIFKNSFFALKTKEEILQKIQENEEKEKNKKYFLMDEEGFLGGEIRKEEVNFPMICDRLAQEAKINTQPLKQEYFSFLKQVFTLSLEKINFSVDYICIPSKQSQEAFAKTKQGIGIYFSSTYALSKQFAIFKEVKGKLDQNNEEIKEYVDLRIEGKVYYK
ncbi:MAG: hypothetical protein ABIF17_02810 [Patescibacteria group bacterium]